LIYSTT